MKLGTEKVTCLKDLKLLGDTCNVGPEFPFQTSPDEIPNYHGIRHFPDSGFFQDSMGSLESDAMDPREIVGPDESSNDPQMDLSNLEVSENFLGLDKAAKSKGLSRGEEQYFFEGITKASTRQARVSSLPISENTRKSESEARMMHFVEGSTAFTSVMRRMIPPSASAPLICSPDQVSFFPKTLSTTSHWSNRESEVALPNISRPHAVLPTASEL